MSKAQILVLCPSGHRRKAQMSPNSNLLQVLEDMCNQEKLDSAEWGLIHQRKKCDITIPWRLLGIPTNALLEMYKLDERRAAGKVTVQFQLPDNSRQTETFESTITLHEMLELYRRQPNSALAALENSSPENNQLHPVCSFMSEEIIGTYALSNTTIRELGLTSGAAAIRFTLRSMTDEDLKKVNERIDEKIARRRRQAAAAESKTETTPDVQSESKSTTATTTNVNPPFPSPPVPTTNTNTSLLFNSNEYSIFRDIPASLPPPTTARQQQPRTLADALGLRISLDMNPLEPSTQTNFNDFKFPETTKGQNLFANDMSKDVHRGEQTKRSDRRPLAYDLNAIPSSPASSSEELPDSFFELTPDDLRSVLHSLRQQSSDDNPLETRAIRERVQSARTVQYEHIAIRFMVNSTYILQGLFYPTEPVSNLIDFVRENLICAELQHADFYLYTSPPRVVLSNLNKPLSSYDLIPAAYVYLGHRKVVPLVIQLSPNVRIGTINEANQLVTQYVFNRTRAMNEEEIKAISTERSNMTPTRTTSTNPPAKRAAGTTQMDDKQLKDKFQKFLPGRK